MSKTQSSSDIAALLMRCADTRTPPLVPVARDLLIDGALRSALRRKDWYVATLDRAPVFFAEVDDLAVVGGVLDVGVRNGVTAAPRQGQSEK